VNRKRKSQKRVVGDIVRIALGDGFHIYARVLEEALFAFYDCRVPDELPIAQIIASPILFFVPVTRNAVELGRWVVVGNAPLDSVLSNPPTRFIQDIQRKNSFSIYDKGQIRPATKEECIGLECEAVWGDTHVEDRLRDHYAGRENIWVESLKIKE
jgi:Immunity protein 26